MENTTPLYEFSQSLADAAEKAGQATVLVDGRNRYPASGILIRPELVLTADHVLQRDNEIGVQLHDGRSFEAALVGRDPASDLALLRLPEPGGQPAIPAESPARVGEIVLALGRPSDTGLQASFGIVTAVRGLARIVRRHRRRPVAVQTAESFIYTDAIPYPGFSGGPLIDAAGALLGINTSGLLQGTSLAVPIHRAIQAAESLETHGSVRRGYLGVRSQAAALDSSLQARLGRDQETGLLIVWVESGSPAAAGGLIVGDILVGIDAEPVDDHESLQHALAAGTAGKSVELELLRGGEHTRLKVTIGERPA